MPTKKTPKIPYPAQIPIDPAMNPLGLSIPEILARLRCFDPDCPCHFPEGKVHCPRRLHLDQTPNFSVIDGPEGPIGQCHVVYLFETERMTCSTEKLREALTRALTTPDEEVPPPVVAQGTFFDWSEATKHRYCSVGRFPLYEVGRLGEGVEREQEVRTRRNGPEHNWIYNLNGVPNGVMPVVYKLNFLPEARLIIVCDNERAADAINEEMLKDKNPLFGQAIAITTMGGLTHLHRTDLSPLFGKVVVFFPTEDGGQRLYANAIIQALDGRAKIRIVELPDRGTGGDYTHFQTAGHTFAKACELIKAAPVR